MTCDPVGGPAGDHIFESKRRVETNRDDAAGTDARNRRKGKPSRAKAKSDEHCQQKQPRTFPCITASHRRGVDPFFVLKPIERAWRSPRKCRGRGVGRVATTKDHKLKKRPRPRPLACSLSLFALKPAEIKFEISPSHVRTSRRFQQYFNNLQYQYTFST